MHIAPLTLDPGRMYAPQSAAIAVIVLTAMAAGYWMARATRNLI